MRILGVKSGLMVSALISADRGPDRVVRVASQAEDIVHCSWELRDTIPTSPPSYMNEYRRS